MPKTNHATWGRLMPTSLVDLGSGQIDVRIFTDTDIYTLEMERIFSRCWLFVAHECQVSSPGQFVTATMGDVPVVVARQGDMTVAVFRNACWRRAEKICLADSGTAEQFLCRSDGWRYGLDGDLQSSPEPLSGSRTALMTTRSKPAPIRVATYKGFIFACMDQAGPSLEDSLGEFAWYLDAMIDRLAGGVELIGPHRWRVPVNWKIPAEQFAGDTYHAGMTHGSLAGVLDPDDPRLKKLLTAEGHQHLHPHGHGASFASGSFRFFVESVMADERVSEFYSRMDGAIRARLGEARADGPTGGTMTVFPNFGTNGTFLRIWNPRSPSLTEVLGWVIVDAASPPDVKDAMRRASLRLDSPTGVVELDDNAIWASLGANVSSLGTRAGPMFLNYQMGLGRDTGSHPDFPGTVTAQFLGENAIRNFYRRWLELVEH